MTDDLASKWSAHAESLLQWSANVAEKAGNFAAEQTPLLVQEYLEWEFWHNVYWTVVWASIDITLFAIVVASLVLARRYYKKHGDSSNSMFACCMVAVVCGIVCAFTFPTVFINARDAAKVKIAPRVIIVEKIADLAKGVRR